MTGVFFLLMLILMAFATIVLLHVEIKRKTKSLVREIDERKRAEESLRLSEAFLGRVIDCVAEPIFVKNRQHRWVLFNKAFCQFIGRRADELKGKSDYDFFPKEEADVFCTKDDQVFLSGGESENEEFFTDSKGFRRTIVTRKTLYKDTAGNAYIVGLIRDITEMKKTEMALKESEVRYRELFSRMKSGVVIYEARDNGMDFIFKDINPSAELVSKVKKEAVLGKSVQDVFPKIRDIGLFALFQRVWRTGISEHLDATLYKDENVTQWVENDVYRLPSGEIVAVYNDISDARKAEEDIYKRTHELEVFYKASIGREERILELKKELQRLKMPQGESS